MQIAANAYIVEYLQTRSYKPLSIHLDSSCSPQYPKLARYSLPIVAELGRFHDVFQVEGYSLQALYRCFLQY